MVGRLAVALAAVVAVIAVGMMSLLAAPASATPLATARNAVGVFAHPAGQRVGFHQQELPGESRQRAPGYDRNVVGSGVGAYTDPTALEYLLHRYYDPTTGQFFSLDPLVLTTLQPYEYVGDNPTTETDPSGIGVIFTPVVTHCPGGNVVGSDVHCNVVYTSRSSLKSMVTDSSKVTVHVPELVVL
jgi:RHS repeat-associated protein